MADDVFVHADQPLDLDHRRRRKLEVEKVVEAVAVMFDGIRQSAPPPSVDADDHAALRCHRASDALDNRARLLIRGLWGEHDAQFVVTFTRHAELLLWDLPRSNTTRFRMKRR